MCTMHNSSIDCLLIDWLQVVDAAAQARKDALLIADLRKLVADLQALSIPI